MTVAIGQKATEHTPCSTLNTQLLQTFKLLGTACYLMHLPLLCLAAAVCYLLQLLCGHHPGHQPC